MSIQAFEVNEIELEIPTNAFLAELGAFLDRLRGGFNYQMFQYNVSESLVATSPIKREKPDKNIFVGLRKTPPEELTFRESGLTRFKFTDFLNFSFSDLLREVQDT